ncbi:hypothetical protein TWF481_004599 [Arthrobotrys musiformis]|uniref:PHD-type domain-containing protein n=1 Tax=Arthrobotrys musiformis TaxID=47236 RepID=A0AAV9WL42_9PEZI
MMATDTAAVPISMPRIKLHFSAGAYPPPPPSPPAESDDEVDEDEEVFESEEPESSSGDDENVGFLEQSSAPPAAVVNRRTEEEAGKTIFDNSVLNAEPVLPFRPIRIILKAPKRNPEEELEETTAATPVRKKRKRRKSKTSHRRYDSSTSSEEYIQSGFKTLSGRTVINPNTRKEPSPPPPLPSKPQSHHNTQVQSPKKSKPKTTMRGIAAVQGRRCPPIQPNVLTRTGGKHRKEAEHMDRIHREENARRLSIILDAKCVKCQKASDSRDDKIVFCDGCERPYHQMCHRPRIDQSYIDVLEKNWFCFNCVGRMGEEDEDIEEGYEEEYEEEDSKMNDLIDQIGAEQEDDESNFRDVEMTSDGHEDEDQQSEEDNGDDHSSAKEGEQEEKPQSTKSITKHLTTIKSQNMEDSINSLDSEKQKLFLQTLAHDDLVDLICRLRSKGAAFNFDFPPGIRNKLLNFARAQDENTEIKKRKTSTTATSGSPKEKKERKSSKPAPSSIESDDASDGDGAPETKRPKLTAAQRYWMWRENPESPYLTHIVYRNGVGRPAHEAEPPLYPFASRKLPEAEVPHPAEESRGGEPDDSKQVK